jgi:hypothetical protein
MHQTDIFAEIMNKKQSDLVASVGNGQTNINLANNNNNNIHKNNNNNNNNSLLNNNNNNNGPLTANGVGRSSINSVISNVQLKTGGPTNGKSQAPMAPSIVAAPDARAKQVLKEAVDAVVNSFAKHTQGYGRGKWITIYIITETDMAAGLIGCRNVCALTTSAHLQIPPCYISDITSAK